MRVRLTDGLVLIAVTAAALALPVDYYLAMKPVDLVFQEPTWSFEDARSKAITTALDLVPIACCWSLAVLGVHARRWMRRGRAPFGWSPGLIAAGLNAAYLVAMLVKCAGLVLIGNLADNDYAEVADIAGFFGGALGALTGILGPMIVSAWAVLFLKGSWSREAEAEGWLGRVIGAWWILIWPLCWKAPYWFSYGLLPIFWSRDNGSLTVRLFRDRSFRA